MIKKVTTVLALSLILASCGQNKEEEIKQESKKETEAPAKVKEEDRVEKKEIKEQLKQPEQEVQSRYAYDQDWEAIKTAILNKDLKGVAAFSGSDAVDAEMLIMFFEESKLAEQLKASTYDDLTVDTQGEEVTLQFTAHETGVNDEGHEVGSAITIVLIQGEPNLEIVNVLAAG